MRIEYYRKLKDVSRLSRVPSLRSYNVLEHTFMVVLLFRYFAKLEDVAYDMQILDRVMHHDILESVTGDLPHDVKHFNVKTECAWDTIEHEVASVSMHTEMSLYTDIEIRAMMSERQYKLFKACDLLDLWIFLKEEQGLGNTHRILHKIVLKCEELIKGKFHFIDTYMDEYKF